jgi:serine/threonine-protein kinase RsbW
MREDLPESVPEPGAAAPRLHWRLPATQAAVRHTLSAQAGTLMALLPVPERRHEAEIALAEALNNIVEHAFAGLLPGEIRVDAVLRAGVVFFEIRDDGRAMPAGPLPGARMPSLDAGDPLDLPEGGFGWALLRALTRDLSYRREGPVNVLRFSLPAIAPDADGPTAKIDPK